MSAALLILAALTAHIALTLLFFAAICRLQMLRDDGKLTPALSIYAYALVLPIGYVLDCSLQMVWGTLVFLRLPRDWLLTGRLIRYKREGTGWRSRLAVLLCEHLLDPLDPRGCHCRT